MRWRRTYRLTAAALLWAISGSALAADLPVVPPSEPILASAAPQTAATTAAKPKKKPKVPRFIFTFPGRGYGHGVGMSQYGAYGMALAGAGHRDILAHYYRGTTLGTLPATTVRVLVGTGAETVRLTSSGDWSAAADGAPLGVATPLPAAAQLEITPLDPAGVLVTGADGAELLRSPAATTFTPASPASTITFGGVRYRGAIRLLVEGGKLTVINAVNLEDYLLGVVPREMPVSWGNTAPAALEAQAIAARSYAIATKRVGGNFDMYRDERSQVYGGVNAEDPRSTRAVQATAGTVVTLNGAIVTTFFFSTSGGKTENVENVFRGSPRSYLIGVDDAQWDAQSPHHVWRDPKTFTDAQLAKLLGLRRPVLTMKVIERGVSPRAKLVRITSRSGAVKIMRGSEIRRALGLRDTWFYVRRAVRTPAPR